MPDRLHIYLFVASLCLSLAMGELIVRLFVGVPVRSGVAISSPHMTLDQRGAVRHFPNEKLRMVSVLEDAIEFDVVYQTNSHGLIDHRAYPVGAGSRHHYVFVGDSFTYGMGADAWVPRLRDRLRNQGNDVEIYNLGVNGASIQHFRALISSVASELPITHIVLIPISNDFYRPWWVPMPARDGINMCWDPPGCTRVRPMYPIIEFDAKPEVLVRRYREERAARLAEVPSDPLWKTVLWQSQLYLLARRRVRQALDSAAPSSRARDPYDLEHPARLGINLEALAGIRKDFPTVPITLAHFPQLNEVLDGIYHLDLVQTARELDMDYFAALTRCSWSSDMYHRANLHPNEAGYRNFADCLWQHVAMKETRDSP